MNPKQNKNKQNYTKAIMIKLLKTSHKKKILKAPRQRDTLHKEEQKAWAIMQARRQTSNIFKILKENKLPT